MTRSQKKIQGLGNESGSLLFVTLDTKINQVFSTMWGAELTWSQLCEHLLCSLSSDSPRHIVPLLTRGNIESSSKTCCTCMRWKDSTVLQPSIASAIVYNTQSGAWASQRLQPVISTSHRKQEGVCNRIASGYDVASRNLLVTSPGKVCRHYMYSLACFMCASLGRYFC